MTLQGEPNVTTESTWADGIDTTFSARLEAAGIVSHFHTAFNRPFAANHRIQLEKATITLKNFFRPLFGDQRLHLEIQAHDGAESEKISFPAQNYYVNQLAFFIRLLQGQEAPPPLEKVRERIVWMESIYEQATPGNATTTGE
uniref:Uncharacterized protein n=1 Tax=Candidatus Kentrum sp. UNK TaxID=2126344 RepID=A0A451ABT2_9GAMM|nr:MAG: hypothetical protein BECKUNK1418G_GA0071005_103411 [Candidatus Kentron sp. UNK]VFK70835.1 MAG: hypothetical protein BECKUNK1418H_GA0071006_104012 [Candidatus Kentron sp. UNK]